MKREVMRPWLLRPPDAGAGAVSFFSGRSLVISAKSKPVIPRRPGDVGLKILMPMRLNSLEEVDLVPLGEGDDRLLPVRAAARETADPLLLAADDLGVHVGDLHVEERLDRLLDLDLVGAVRHL